MEITRQSIFTGKRQTKSIDCKVEDYDLYMKGEVLIQNAMPYLSSSDREFIMTGADDKEFDMLFKEA